MFTEEQMNQLKGLLLPIENRMGSIEERMSSLEVQQQTHARQSKEDHDKLFTVTVESAEANDKAYKETFTHHDSRITRVEKNLNLPPME